MATGYEVQMYANIATIARELKGIRTAAERIADALEKDTVLRVDPQWRTHRPDSDDVLQGKAVQDG